MPIMHRLIPSRIVIYAKDIENITGRSERTARQLLQRIRKANGKKKEEFVTVKEFCQFTGLKTEEVAIFLEH